jgi:hypothetical protein
MFGSWLRLGITAVALCLWLGGVAFGQVRIGSTAELERALGKAKGGERIELAPGRYDRLTLTGRRGVPVTWPSAVTVTSADPNNPATLSALDLRFVDNLTFTNLVFGYRFSAGDIQRTKPFMLRDVSRITIRASQFKGDRASGTGTAADGFGTAIGLDVTGADDLRVEDNRFELWHRGAVFLRVTKLAVIGNTITQVRSDGFNFVEITDAVIERNHFHDFRTSLETGDHPDMIQFWTNKTKTPSSNVVIRSNILDSGSGPWTQSIFMRNEEVDNRRAGTEMFYRNIEITGNVIRNAHVHGITVGEVDGLVIANNTLIQSVESPRPLHVTTPGINIKPASTNVRITNNIAPRYGAFSPGWMTENNATIQRLFPRQPNFYNAVFVDALALGTTTLSDLELLPSAPASYAGAGSPLLRFNERSTRPRLILSTTPVSAGRSAAQRFVVSAAYGPSGRIDLAGASAIWMVDESTALTGLEVTHQFAGSGLHRPRVRVTWPNGQSIESARTLLVE